MNVTPDHPRQSNSILRAARHVLFVEGADEGSFDREVLDSLFEDRIEVRALAASYNVRSAAQVLAQEHSTYYFLIDRDCYDESFVNQCWKNFPDPEKDNLLVWRKRELENYFLDPTYLGQSRFVRREADLEACIVKHARNYVVLDAVNYVINGVRQTLKKTWITIPRNPAEFKSREDAIRFLSGCTEFVEKRAQINERTSHEWLTNRFDAVYEEMTGRQDPIRFGQGAWLARISGKRIFSSVVSECMLALDAQGNELTGKEAQIAIGKDLISQSLDIQPEDFRTLRRLILARARR